MRDRGRGSDLILVATVTPDMVFPSTACLLQGRLGAEKAAAFDLSAGCTGFIYALAVADRFLMAGDYRFILVVGAETLSRITDYTDRNTCVLFGDGAGAVILGRGSGPNGILSTYLAADGSENHCYTYPPVVRGCRLTSDGGRSPPLYSHAGE